MLRLCLLLIIVTSILSLSYASDDKWILRLNGLWQFELGDNPQWSEPDYNDSFWDKIYVPSTWEDEGFPGYDGYAWYRIRFRIDPKYKNQVLYLRLGVIDDVDETYLNGHLLDYKGSFPPDFVTWAHFERQYPINNALLNFDDENVLAIRVFDVGGAGGIKSGDNGILSDSKAFIPDINLRGIWKFQTGDQMTFADPEFDDNDWAEVIVPAIWATYGLKKYDGFAWYRKSFSLPAEFQNKYLILLVGKIDDFDEVYINGQQVGGTGNIKEDTQQIDTNTDDWEKLRAYTIPKNMLSIDRNNIIAVRVYDGGIYGGIYDGPIGITTTERYLEWQKTVKKKSFCDLIFE